MRKLFFIPAILLGALVSCNSGTGSGSSTDSTAVTPDTSATAAAKPDTVPTLPAIPAGAKVYFKNIKDGATVSSPVKIEFGVDKMTVAKKAPDGQIAEGIGHHHLLVDSEDSIPSGQVIPDDSTHFHYGKGQTDATITLSPGKHKLTLQFGDAIHRSYGSELAKTINVTVK